jgi:hypothetical protein
MPTLNVFTQSTLQSPTTKDEIDVSKYAKGMYFIQIENAVKKVIIE